MIAFEIKINGQSLGIAGAEDLAVLTAIVTAVGKLGPQSHGAYQRENDHHTEIRVGGLTSRAEAGADEHLDWIQQTLKLGDVITITLVDATSTDSPSVSQPARTDYKQQFEWAKNFYLNNRDKFDGG